MTDPPNADPAGGAQPLLPAEPQVDASLLVRIANALLITYGLQVILVLSEHQASPSAAILAVSAQLADQAVLPLLAVALLQLTSALVPADRPLLFRCRRQREARWVSGLLLLLLPVQLLLGGAELLRLSAGIRQENEAVASRVRQVRAAILVAESRPALIAALEQLKAPPLPPELQQRPLPQLKRSLLSTLAAAQQRSDSLSRPQLQELSRARTELLQRLLQTSLLSLVYAFALRSGLRLLGQTLRWEIPGWAARAGSGPGAGHDHDYFLALSQEEGQHDAGDTQPPLSG